MWPALIGHTRAQSRSGRMCLAACASCILALGWGQARAQQLASIPAPTLRIESLEAAKLISGWVEFCHRVPAECAVDRDEPLTLTLTPKSWSVIVATNRVVNAAIKPITDQEHWGVWGPLGHPGRRLWRLRGLSTAQAKAVGQSGAAQASAGYDGGDRRNGRGPCRPDGPHGLGRLHPGQQADQ